jgi:hypothetical protein
MNMRPDVPVVVHKAHADEISAVLALQQHAFKEVGHLACEHARQMGNVFPYNNDRHTDVLVAIQHATDGTETLIGTLSLTVTEAHRIPLVEEDFPGAIHELLSSPKRTAVLWRFVIPPSCRNSLYVAMYLMAEALIAGEERGIERLLCVVNPERHQPFYRDRLGFSEAARTMIGEAHPTPAALFVADTDTLKRSYHPMIRKFMAMHKRTR